MKNSVFLDKVCIVTGGASGLGREVCQQLVAVGACVVLADIDFPRATEVVGEITRIGGTAKAVWVDVTNSESVQALVEGAATEFGRIDYLFNNAGTVVMGEIRDLSLEHWRRVIEINLFGGIYGIHYVYPIMIRQGFGHIVNTASGFGLAPGPLNSPYVASKFALIGISHALAIEAHAFGVDVSVVCPGFIQTPLIDNVKPLNADAKEMLGQIPVKMVPVEHAARIMLAGVAKKKTVIAFPAYVGVLVFLYRFMPWLYKRMGWKQIADFRSIRKAQ